MERRFHIAVAVAALAIAVAIGEHYKYVVLRTEARSFRAKVARKLATYEAIGCKIDRRAEQEDLGLLVATFSEDDIVFED